MKLNKNCSDDLLNFLKILEFDYIDLEKYNTTAHIFFDKQNEGISIFSSKDVGGLSKQHGTQKAVDDYFFVINDKTQKYDATEIANKVTERIEEIDRDFEFKNITLIMVYNSIEQKYKGNTDLDPNNLKRRVKKIVDKKKTEKFLLRDINYTSVVIPDIPSQESIIKIDIIDRIRSLEQNYKLDNGIEIKGYVFTADINSIIKLYNDFGDDLFDRNVRIGGVTDNMGVDDAIKNTYSNAPEEFWFYNNGISLLIESTNDLDLDVFNCIKFSVKDLQDISVINGAQTIKAVSEACYEMKKSEMKFLKNPNVILRVYFYNSGLDVEQDTQQNNIENSEKDKTLKKAELARKFREFSEKVTISLNKQKPIKQSDLAFMTNFVKNIQEIKVNILNESDIENMVKDDGRALSNSEIEKIIRRENKLRDLIFDFVRRGETSSIYSRLYQLDVFAKVVRAYLQNQPGSSRSMSYATLLRLEKSSPESGSDANAQSLDNVEKTVPRLSETGTFVSGLQDPWDDGNVDEFKNEFLKYYSPVNFAMSMKKYLEDTTIHEGKSKTNFIMLIDSYCSEKEEIIQNERELLDSFAKYGTLFMVATVIHYLNKEVNQNIPYDFSDWKYTNISFEENSENTEVGTSLNVKKLDSIIKLILDHYLAEIPNDDSSIKDSNYWKTDALMDKLNSINIQAEDIK